MKIVKRVLVNDLETKRSGFNYGLTSSFGIVTTRSVFMADYSTSDEDGISEDGAEIHTEEYLAKTSQREAKASRDNMIRAERTLIELDKNFANLDPEIVMLLADQLTDINEAPNDFSIGGNGDTSVSITVQRKTLSGQWSNVMDKVWNDRAERYDKVKAEYFFDISDLFNLNDQGEPTTFKVSNTSGDELVLAFMADFGYSTVHNYNYVDTQTKEMVFKSQDQRFLLKSVSLKAGVIIENERLESTVAPFFNKYDTKAKEVYEELSYYGYDNLVDFSNGIVLMVSTEDESHGDAANKDYNYGIQVGKAIATKAMETDDMAIQHINAMRQENARLDAITLKTRKESFNKKAIKLSDNKAVLETDLGKVVSKMAPLTYAALKNAKLQNEIFEELKAYKDNASELLKAVEAYKSLNGKGFAYPSWKCLDAMVKVSKDKAFADMVEEHILTNIDSINKGLLKVDDLDNESLIEIREASVAHGRKNKACWIKDVNVSNAIKLKYAHVKGVKVS
jgi:hypothetical protein